MKYFLDTEFLEGTQKGFFGKTKPTIDLISIGLVDITGREFYAISKEFNLKEAWNRWEQHTGDLNRNNIAPRKYWIRDNVLLTIWKELIKKELDAADRWKQLVSGNKPHVNVDFTYTRMKQLIKKYGQSNKEIVNGVCAFIYGDDCGGSGISAIEMSVKYGPNDLTKIPQFYGYFSAYDWVVFCWLFGKMIDLPKEFPKYCHDLKQMLNAVAKIYTDPWTSSDATFETRLSYLKAKESYPKNSDEHNALADAKWNLELYNFIKAEQKKLTV